MTLPTVEGTSETKSSNDTPDSNSDMPVDANE
jgi:hypothetical protein